MGSVVGVVPFTFVMVGPLDISFGLERRNSWERTNTVAAVAATAILLSFAQLSFFG